MCNSISQIAAGTTDKVKLWRDSAERELTVKLAEVEALPSEKVDATVKASVKATGPLAGVCVDNLTPDKARLYRFPTGINFRRRRQRR